MYFDNFSTRTNYIYKLMKMFRTVSQTKIQTCCCGKKFKLELQTPHLSENCVHASLTVESMHSPHMRYPCQEEWPISPESISNHAYLENILVFSSLIQRSQRDWCILFMVFVISFSNAFDKLDNVRSNRKEKNVQYRIYHRITSFTILRWILVVKRWPVMFQKNMV